MPTRIVRTLECKYTVVDRVEKYCKCCGVSSTSGDLVHEDWCDDVPLRIWQHNGYHFYVRGCVNDAYTASTLSRSGLMWYTEYDCDTRELRFVVVIREIEDVKTLCMSSREEDLYDGDEVAIVYYPRRDDSIAGTIFVNTNNISIR